MTGPFEVRWAAVAEADLLGIITFIASDSVEAAVGVLDRIRVRATQLASNPNRGRVVPELRRQGIAHYRELIITPWRLIYRIEGRNVYVVAVIDGRRSVEDVLLSRFIG